MGEFPVAQRGTAREEAAPFFAGRLVSYSLYVAGASAVKKTNLGNLLVSSLTSPWGIAVQVAFLAGVVALAHIDWAGLMVHRFRR